MIYLGFGHRSDRMINAMDSAKGKRRPLTGGELRKITSGVDRGTAQEILRRKFVKVNQSWADGWINSHDRQWLDRHVRLIVEAATDDH